MDKPGKNVLVSAKNAKGRKVYGPDSGRIGVVEDLMVDTRTGYVEYAVVAMDSRKDEDGKYVAVPLHAFRIEDARAAWVLDMGDGEYRVLPGFRKDGWSEGDQAEFIEDFHRRFGMGSVDREPSRTENIGKRTRENIEPEESEDMK